MKQLLAAIEGAASGGGRQFKRFDMADTILLSGALNLQLVFHPWTLIDRNAVPILKSTLISLDSALKMWPPDWQRRRAEAGGWSDLLCRR